jgi:hypothetical protein
VSRAGIVSKLQLADQTPLAGDGVDMGMKVKVISVALNGNDGARQGGRVGSDFLKHLLEGLPGGFAEQAEFLRVVSEDGAQKLWDGEDEGI